MNTGDKVLWGIVVLGYMALCFEIEASFMQIVNGMMGASLIVLGDMWLDRITKDERKFFAKLIITCGMILLVIGLVSMCMPPASATIVNQTTDTQILWTWSDIEPPYDIWLNGEKVVDNSTLSHYYIDSEEGNQYALTVIGNDTSETNTVKVIYRNLPIYFIISVLASLICFVIALRLIPAAILGLVIMALTTPAVLASDSFAPEIRAIAGIWIGIALFMFAYLNGGKK